MSGRQDSRETEAQEWVAGSRRNRHLRRQIPAARRGVTTRRRPDASSSCAAPRRGPGARRWAAETPERIIGLFTPGTNPVIRSL